MPVTQLVALIRNTPPQSAAGLLTAMPADRFPVVVAALSAADLARVLPATRPDTRDMLIAALSTSQLTDLVCVASIEQNAALLPRLPHDRLTDVVDGLTDPVVSDLYGGLPRDGRNALLAVLKPPRVHAVLARSYETDVARALVRDNAEVSVVLEPPDGILLVQSLGWRIAVAARYADDGTTAVRHAEKAAYRLRANGALSVTNYQPAAEVVQYCRQSREEGRPVDAVAWTDAEDDGPLKRTLVGLFR